MPSERAGECDLRAHHAECAECGCGSSHMLPVDTQTVTCPYCGGEAQTFELEGGRGDLGSSRHALSGPPLSGEKPNPSVGEHGPEKETTDG